MNPFLKITKIGLTIFFLGFLIGFVLTLLFPEIGKANYDFQVNQANWLRTFYTGKQIDLYFISFVIFLRNLLIALLFAISPLILIHYVLRYRTKHQFESEHSQKLKNEIYRLLTFYSISVLFMYGFLVYGLFFGFILINESVNGLVQWLIYFIPHGILETLGIILAASTGLILRDIWIKKEEIIFKTFWYKIICNNYIKYLIILVIIFIISGLIEVNISSKIL